MHSHPPTGETPPAPGLEKEEPELMVERDIPADDGAEREAQAVLDQEDELHEVERE
jgi:hypothetical protein